MKDHNYTNLALDIRAIFEMHHKMLNALSFPFFFEFPKDSCESASVFFGVCVKQIFPNADVKIVHGTTRGQSDYHHYWVEIDKKTYDLTLDQFQDSQNSGNVFSPIYSKQKHPLANLFYYKKRNDITVAFIDFITNTANLNEVLNAFHFCYVELGKLGWFSDFHNLKR